MGCEATVQEISRCWPLTRPFGRFAPLTDGVFFVTLLSSLSAYVRTSGDEVARVQLGVILHVRQPVLLRSFAREGALIIRERLKREGRITDYVTRLWQEIAIAAKQRSSSLHSNCYRGEINPNITGPWLVSLGEDKTEDASKGKKAGWAGLARIEDEDILPRLLGSWL